MRALAVVVYMATLATRTTLLTQNYDTRWKSCGTARESLCVITNMPSAICSFSRPTWSVIAGSIFKSRLATQTGRWISLAMRSLKTPGKNGGGWATALLMARCLGWMSSAMSSKQWRAMVSASSARCGARIIRTGSHFRCLRRT